MKKIIFFVFNLFLSQFATGQFIEGSMANCANKDFNRKVNKMLNYSVEVISVEELKSNLSDYILLDARELDEYLVSRIPGAQHFGYDNPKWDSLEELDKNKAIVVYCSIGYRSEKIGEKLMKQGFIKVRNLYGSIFEWANQGCELEDPRGLPTTRVHTYNKKWSKWVDNDLIEKVY